MSNPQTPPGFEAAPADMQRAMEALSTPAIVISCTDEGDGHVRIRTGVVGIDAARGEACAQGLLADLVRAMSHSVDCLHCPTCQSRLARLQAAIAALQGPIVGAAPAVTH